MRSMSAIRVYKNHGKNMLLSIDRSLGCKMSDKSVRAGNGDWCCVCVWCTAGDAGYTERLTRDASAGKCCACLEPGVAGVAGWQGMQQGRWQLHHSGELDPCRRLRCRSPTRFDR